MPYRPHLVSSTTRPIVRSLVQKVFGDFDPLRLDPYLFFDAATSMVGTLENPTLDLDPSKPDTLNVITATRAGTATFTNANGLIASASPNTVRVDQTQGAELTPTKFQRVGYTDFNNATLWAKNDATLTSGQLSPTGDNTATKLTATGSDPWVYAVINTSAQTHTFSFYCKGEGPTIGKTARVLFWYIGGATGTTQSVDFTYSGEWQRFEFQTTPTGAGTLYYRIDIPSDTGVVGESVYIYGPQLEEGTTASDFVANTTGSPKFITGATFGPRVPMILVEPSATNLLTATQEVASWTRTNVSVTSNTTTAPDGSQTGDTVTRTAGGADVRQTKAVTSGTSYTMSIFAKAETDNQIQLDFSNSRMGADNVEFNTRTGQKVSGSNNYTITELSNGWRRYSFTSTCISSGNTGVIIRIENDEPVQLWGFQFEEGSVPTSYIPHISGSTVTRAADDLVISGSAFSSFFNATQGTVYAEFLYDHDEISKYLYSISQDGSNEIRCQNRVGSLRTRYTVNNSHVASLENNGILKGSLNRAAFSYKTNNFRANLNGGSDDEELSATASLNQVKLSIGSRSGTAQLNGHIKRLIYWPTHSDSL